MSGHLFMTGLVQTGLLGEGNLVRGSSISCRSRPCERDDRPSHVCPLTPSASLSFAGGAPHVSSTNPPSSLASKSRYVVLDVHQEIVLWIDEIVYAQRVGGGTTTHSRRNHARCNDSTGALIHNSIPLRVWSHETSWICLLGFQTTARTNAYVYALDYGQSTSFRTTSKRSWSWSSSCGAHSLWAFSSSNREERKTIPTLCLSLRVLCLTIPTVPSSGSRNCPGDISGVVSGPQTSSAIVNPLQALTATYARPTEVRK